MDLIEGLQHLQSTWLSLLLICLLVTFYALKIFTSRRLNLPPAPPRLPIIGNLHQLGADIHRSFHTLSQKYGPVMLVHFCTVPTLVVSDEATSRKLLNDAGFQNRPRIKLADALFYGSTDVAFCPHGEYWRAMKKICVAELFSLKRVQACRSVREEEAGAMVERIRRRCDGEEAVDLSEMFIGVASDVVSRSAFGRKYARGEDGGRESFGGLAREAMKLMGEFNFEDFVPYLGWIDNLTGFNGRVKETVRAFHGLLDRVIEEHEDNNGDERERDLVDVFLDLEKNNELDVNVTKDNLKAILLDMFIGGTDNNASTMEWAMAELARNPGLMKKAQDEARRVIGNKAKVEETDVEQMPYLKCVIKETLRLHTPVMITRESTVTTRLNGYDIPAGTRVMVNAWAIQRDHTLWERSEEFLPERFTEVEVDLKGQQSRFIPFGCGRRICPGILFSMAEMECVLANLLFWFDWKLPDGQAPEDMDMSDVFGLVIRKKVPLHLVPVARERDCQQ